MSVVILKIAVPTPLRRSFDYRLPGTLPLPPPGARVRVPFGKRQAVGVVLETTGTSALPWDKLKPISAVLDEQALLPPDVLALLLWAADYYHHPIGEVVHGALPALLRAGRAAVAPRVAHVALTQAGRAGDPGLLKRAPLQQKIWQALAVAPEGLSEAALTAISPGWRKAVRALNEKGWAQRVSVACVHETGAVLREPPTLIPAQATAVAAVAAAERDYACFLLHGITGSGKTEVYFQLVARTLAAGRQALVLVPEIGLTPQLVQRFRERFRAPIAVLHSGLSDQERLSAWVSAREGSAAIVIGTRSAVFTPLARPGLILVDEEHDASFKQQDGFRYHARDLAVLRAQRSRIPIVLGSATPSLDSLHNAMQGRYRLLELTSRVGVAALPKVHLLDMHRLATLDGLSHPLLHLIEQRLNRREQTLLFLNRRGFSPVFMCYACGFIATCSRCDARMVWHKGARRLRCHHCGADRAAPVQCEACGGSDFHGIGEGTQRLEAALARRFPGASIVRIDRDSTQRKHAFTHALQAIHDGTADILIGTQMLSKGHHFPNVTLVGIVNADQGLYGADFRASEHLFQQIMQVTGRAGRGDKPGEVVIQTFHPEHPLFRAARHHDYRGFAECVLAERRAAEYPPFAHLALLRAESPSVAKALAFLQRAHALGRERAHAEVRLAEPVPSPMERRAGRYRAQLLVQSPRRGLLHAFLAAWLSALEQEPRARHVRWSLDVDPLSLY